MIYQYSVGIGEIRVGSYDLNPSSICFEKVVFNYDRRGSPVQFVDKKIGIDITISAQLTR